MHARLRRRSEADDDDFGLAPTGVHLDFDGIRFDSIHRGRSNLGQYAEILASLAALRAKVMG